MYVYYFLLYPLYITCWQYAMFAIIVLFLTVYSMFVFCHLLFWIHHPNCTGTWTGTFWYETAQTRFILHNQCSQNWITLDDGTVIHVHLVYNCALTYASLKKVLNSAWWVYWHKLELSMCTYSYKPQGGA